MMVKAVFKVFILLLCVLPTLHGGLYYKKTLVARKTPLADVINGYFTCYDDGYFRKFEFPKKDVKAAFDEIAHFDHCSGAEISELCRLIHECENSNLKFQGCTWITGDEYYCYNINAELVYVKENDEDDLIYTSDSPIEDVLIYTSDSPIELVYFDYSSHPEDSFENDEYIDPEDRFEDDDYDDPEADSVETKLHDQREDSFENDEYNDPEDRFEDDEYDGPEADSDVTKHHDQREDSFENDEYNDPEDRFVDYDYDDPEADTVETNIHDQREDSFENDEYIDPEDRFEDDEYDDPEGRAVARIFFRRGPKFNHKADSVETEFHNQREADSIETKFHGHREDRYGKAKEMGRRVSRSLHRTLCKVPIFRTAVTKCVRTSVSVGCIQRCALGYTLEKGITGRYSCNYTDKVWRPTKMHECKPYVDCGLELVSPGRISCSPSTPRILSVCTITCGATKTHAATGPRDYKCKTEGFWKPGLPFCVTRLTGRPLVRAPKVKSHFSNVTELHYNQLTKMISVDAGSNELVADASST